MQSQKHLLPWSWYNLSPAPLSNRRVTVALKKTFWNISPSVPASTVATFCLGPVSSADNVHCPSVDLHSSSHTSVDSLWAFSLREPGSSHSVRILCLPKHKESNSLPQTHPQHEPQNLPRVSQRIQKHIIPDDFYKNTFFNPFVYRWEHQRHRNFMKLFWYSAEHIQAWNQYCDVRRNIINRKAACLKGKVRAVLLLLSLSI